MQEHNRPDRPANSIGRAIIFNGYSPGPRHTCLDCVVLSFKLALFPEAYLEVDRHAEPCIRFLLHHFGAHSPLPGGGVRVVVFTRFDDEHRPPLTLHRLRAPDAGDGDPVLELHLYNTSGSGVWGFHYDPVYRMEAEPAPVLPEASGGSQALAALGDESARGGGALSTSLQLLVPPEAPPATQPPPLAAGAVDSGRGRGGSLLRRRRHS